MKRIILSLVVSSFIISAMAQVPKTLSFQGYLTDQAGEPANGNFDMRFSIHDAFTGGTEVWFDDYSSVPVSKGLYTVILGDKKEIDKPFNVPYYLEVKVGLEKLIPRITLSSSAYSISSINAANITSGTIDNARLDTDLQDLADGSLSGTKVGAGIDAANITTGSLSGTIIGAGINAANITTGTIDNTRLDTDLQDLADGSLSGSKVTPDFGAQSIATTGSISATSLSGTLSTSNLSGTVTVANGGTGGTTQVAARSGLGLGSLAVLNTITSSEITDLSIAAADLSDGSVTASKLSSTTVTPGSYGNSNQVGAFTVDAQGRVTAASNVTITGAAPTGLAGGDLTGNFPNPTIGTNKVVASNLASGSVSGGLAGTISDNSITNDDISGAAGIAGSKIVPNFGNQNIVTTGSLSAASLTGALAVSNLSGSVSVTNGGTGGTTQTTARSGIGAAASGANSDITSLSGLTTALSLGQGGTGGNSATAARTSLGAAASGANNDITSLSGLTTALSIGQGGTGGNSASAARTSLSAAASGVNSDITSLSGLTTDLSVAQGGTGASTLTGVLFGNGTSAFNGLSSSGASQYLRRNAANNAYEFGTLSVASSEIANGAILDANINGSANIADSKLATISTAGKVSGSSITSGTIAGSTIINTSGTITGASFAGSGAGLTSLTAANITGTNTLPASVLPTTVPLGNGVTDRVTFWSGTGTVSSDVDLSWNGTTNTLSSLNFSGNGSGLTSLTAASITGTNTLPAGVLPTTVPLGNGATDRITLWSGTGSVSSDADLSWNGATNTLAALNFSGNGSGLTSLTAANIAGTNTLPSGVLPTTVPLGNGATDRVTLWSGTGTVNSDADLSWNGTTNTLAALNLSGNGSALTSITAGNITGANTLPAGVLPTTVPLGNGATDRVTFWSGTGSVSSNSNFTWNSGTSTLTATNFSGNGAAITSITPANISGTIADTQLETTIDRTTFNASSNVTAGGYLGATGGVHVGNTTAPTTSGNLEVDGFSKLGSTSPIIKLLKLTGTTGGAEGFDILVPHGLNPNKIISIDATVEYNTTLHAFISPNYKINAELEFGWYSTDTDIHIVGASTNSGSLLTKPFKIIITYEQ